MTIAFDPVLLTGIEEIDAQHRELFVRVDRLLEASRARRSKEEVFRLLDFVGSYVVEHFATEEGCMAATLYPGMQLHLEEHRQFAREVDAFRDEVRVEGPTTLFVIRVGNRMAQWLRDHIYRSDRVFGEWLRARRTPG